MRALGLDLGTKTLGIAVSDKTNTIATPLKVETFPKEDYNYLIKIVKEYVEKYNITNIVLGLPKNMDNSLGFASERSLKFKKLLEECLDLKIDLVDERLSTVEALGILKETGNKNINQKHIVDAVAASIILESYLRGSKNEK